MKTKITSLFPRLLLCAVAGFSLCALASPLAAQDRDAVLKAAADGTTVFVEAEGFANKGGWAVDQQYMDQMGSPVLLAHGIGKPVADATTEVVFPHPGDYRVFVRTRNWVAKWTPQYAPGAFKLAVDGKELETTFGTTGEAWHWQPGGTVRISSAKTKLALRDLQGFDGRCDAILFTSDPKFTPPDGELLAAFRRRALGLADDPVMAPNAPEGPFDLVVAGGGMAGICAAVSASRLGLKVALIQDRPVLGGNNSSEVRVHLRGRINYPPYENVGNLVGQLDPIQTGIAKPGPEYRDDRKLGIVRAEKNITLYLSTRVMAVEMDGAQPPSGYSRPTIRAVIAKNIETGRELRFAAPQFVDSTGDGTLGYLAGAEWRIGRESRAETGEPLAPEDPDSMTMGASVPWNTIERFDAQGRPLKTAFPKLPWAIQYNAETFHPETHGDWNWESGLNKNQITEVEEIRDNLYRAIYGHWDWMKNRTPAGWEDKVHNRELNWMPILLGRRESRRLIGDVILDQHHVMSGETFDDGCVIATWDIDLHYPTALHRKHFPGEEFKTVSDRHAVRPHHIPYRCLYSKDVPNLFMAGRDISVTHVALGTVRVMRTTGMMGEVVGMAAAVCKTYNATPRDVYKKHFSELAMLMKKGVAPKPAEYQKTAKRLPVADIPRPEWLPRAGFNIATNARLEVSSRQFAEVHPPRRINDGGFEYFDGDIRYLTDKSDGPHYIIFRYADPVSINTLRVVTGHPPGVDPVTDFVFQYKPLSHGGDWVDLPQARVTGNTDCDWDARFPAVTAREFRLLITRTPGGVASILDIQFYYLDDAPAPVRGKAGKAYDFPGRYKKKAAQGMAIHGDSAFLLNHAGRCRIYNLKTRALEAEFDLASAGKDNHANCASFGVEYPRGNDKYPALYISQCRGDWQCYVESVDERGARLVQTLQIKTGGPEDISFDWIVDREQKCLYTLARLARDMDETGTSTFVVTKLPLPPLDKPRVVFGKSDIIEQFTLSFTNLPQGATIRGGKLYLPAGRQAESKYKDRKDHNRALIIVDLKTKQIEKKLDLNDAIKDEPEDVDFYKDTLLLYAGQAGGLYEISH